MSDAPLTALREAMRIEDLLAVSQEARKVLKANPNLGAGWSEVVTLADNASDYLAAKRAAEKLTQALPNDQSSWIWLAESHAKCGDIEEAIKIIERLRAGSPEDPSLMRRLGRLSLDAGLKDEAAQYFTQSIQYDFQSALAWEGLAEAKTFAAGDEQLMQLENLRISQTEKTPANQRGIVSYALAKAYEDMGEYEVSARRVSEGAAFYRDSAPFDVARHEFGCNHLLRTYDESFVDINEEAGLVDPRPVFILGAPACGVTWLTQVLGAHEDTTTLDRRNGLFWLAASPLGDQTREDLHHVLVTNEEENALTRVGQAYMQLVDELNPQGYKRVIDSSSLGEMAAGAAGLALPAARFIRVKRDPRDAAWAIFKRRFRHGRNWSYHPDDIARVLVCHNNLMDRWAALFPDRYLTVNYEDLARRTEDEVRRIAFFAGVDGETAVAASWTGEGLFKTDPVGVHERAGSRYDLIEGALERAGLI